MKFEITFDPTFKPDVKDVFKNLHKLYPEIPEDYSKFSTLAINDPSVFAEKIRVYNTKIEELNEQKSLLTQQLEDASKNIQDKEESICDYSNKIDNLNNELINKEKEISDLYSQLESIEKEKDDLTRKNKELHKKLSNYEDSSLNGDISSEKHFSIEGNQLLESLAINEPFVGKVDSNGNASFNFNTEKGTVKYYCQSISELEPFCEIIEKVEDANEIRPGNWGEGHYKDGIITITKKAQIKLVRV